MFEDAQSATRSVVNELLLIFSSVSPRASGEGQDGTTGPTTKSFNTVYSVVARYLNTIIKPIANHRGFVIYTTTPETNQPADMT